MAEVFSIVYKPNQTPDPKDSYQRIPLESAMLVAGHGIQGDRKGGSPNRQLNIVTYDSVETLQADGFNVTPGQLGEQIVLKGVTMADLQPGAQIRVGDDALIEVISERHGCDRFEFIQQKPRENAAGRIGVMARVLQGGAIRIGDPVHMVPVTV
jgi:MOSC domain-containing protein YiiM